MKELLKKTFLYRYYHNFRVAKALKKEHLNNRKNRGDVINKHLPPGGVGAELGVLNGQFSRVLLDFCLPKELHLIDPWYFLDSHWSWASGNNSTVEAVRRILKEFKVELEQKRVFVHIEDDLVVLERFPDNNFDWIYIDSSHQYMHTFMELEILKKKIKPNGVICGDDWRPDINHRHHGVYKAVNEFMNKEGYSLIYASSENLQWFIKKTQFV
jgi:SAM-dependent methyltransferase